MTTKIVSMRCSLEEVELLEALATAQPFPTTRSQVAHTIFQKGLTLTEKPAIQAKTQKKKATK